MPQKLEIKLSRFDNSPWGFRVHGGADFGSPFTVQKVNIQSLGEKAGILPGDVIVKVNGQDISLLKHKDAQEAIKRAGNNFVLAVERNSNGLAQQQQQQKSNFQQGQTWAPKVTPVGQMPSKPTHEGQTFTKTSLEASNKQEDAHWDVKHNQVAKGFSAQPQPQKLNGVNLAPKQYNNPQGLYSDDSIKEILSQQAETLANGVKGINFTTCHPTAQSQPGDISSSETLKMVRDMDEHKDIQASDNDPGLANKNIQSASFKLLEKSLDLDVDLSGVHTKAKAPRVQSSEQSGFKSVSAPVTKSRPDGHQPAGQPPMCICGQCDRLITGIFCKVNGKPIHSECLKCSTCSAALKNVGYFTVGDKLYCEPHSRAAKASKNIGQHMGGNPGFNKQQHPQPQQRDQRQQSEQQKTNWNEILDSDKAGSATNAEDFTKEFMSQMFGGQKASVQPNNGHANNANRLPQQNMGVQFNNNNNIRSNQHQGSSISRSDVTTASTKLKKALQEKSGRQGLFR